MFWAWHLAQEGASGHDWMWELGHGAGVGAVGQTLILEIRLAPVDWNIRPDGKEAYRLGELVVKIWVRWAAESRLPSKIWWIHQWGFCHVERYCCHQM